MAYTADDILADAKLRAFYPTSGGVLADSDIVRLMNDELLGILTAREMSAVQGHLAIESTTSIVANQARYDVPYRAAGGKLRYVALMDNQGNRSNLRPGRPERFATTYNVTQTGTAPTNCWFEDGRLVLFQVPNDASKSIVWGFYLRPGRMQLKANATFVTAAAAAGATSISVSAVPNNTSGLGGNLVGSTSIDIVAALPGFQNRGYDLACTAIVNAGTSITLSSGLPYALSVGDWVTVPEESVAPQLPGELHPLLAARTALRILRSRGDADNAALLIEDIKDLEANAFEYLANRNEGQVDTMASNDLLAGGKSRFGFGLGGF